MPVTTTGSPMCSSAAMDASWTSRRDDEILRRCEQFACSLETLFGDDLLAVWLYGSCATKTNHAESDVDVAIILTEAGKKRYEQNTDGIASDCDDLEFSMARELAMPVSLLIWSEERLSREIAFCTGFASRLLEKNVVLFQKRGWMPK